MDSRESWKFEGRGALAPSFPRRNQDDIFVALPDLHGPHHPPKGAIPKAWSPRVPSFC